MPLYSKTAAAAADFDGTGDGDLDFAIGNTDAERALIQNIGLSSTIDMATQFIRLAPSKAQLDLGEYIELTFNGAASLGVSLYSCEILVPTGWHLFVVTTGASAAIKYWNVDWRRVAYTTYK
jgi:hypothetical protein